MTHQEYIDSLKASAIRISSESALVYIFAQVPILNSPFLKQITTKLIKKTTEIIINQTELGLFFAYIDTRTNKQGELFAQMAYNNYKAQKNGTEQEKKIAEENLINAFKSFVSLRN